MAAQTPEQKAAAEKAAAERAARDAAEREAAEAAASAEAVEETVTRLTVVGPAVVLGTADGSERYLYRGAVVARDAFTEKSIEHAISNGLVAEVETLVVVEASE